METMHSKMYSNYMLSQANEGGKQVIFKKVFGVKIRWGFSGRVGIFANDELNTF